MKIRNLLVILVLLVFLPPSYSDKLFLKDGRIIEGEIAGEMAGKYVIKYTTDNGKLESDLYKTTDVERIEEEPGDQSVPPPQPTENSNQIGESQIETKKDSPYFRWVLARGAGTSSDEAKKDAWRNAIEKVAGVFITAESQILNGQLIEDTITTHSNAYIDELKIIEENEKGGIFRVRIHAKVATKMAFEELESMDFELEYRSVDGHSHFARIETKEERSKSSEQILLSAMRGYPEDVIDITIGKERSMLDGVIKNDHHHLIIPIKFNFNTKNWNSFSKNLNNALKLVCEDSNSFRIRPPRLEWYNNEYKAKFQQSWERALILSPDPHNGDMRHHLPRLTIDKNLNEMYSINMISNEISNLISHDRIHDVVVIADQNMKNAISYAVSSSNWNTIRFRMRQVPSFYFECTGQTDSSIGHLVNDSELNNSTFQQLNGYKQGVYARISSIPFACFTLDYGGTTNNLPSTYYEHTRLLADVKMGDIDGSDSWNSPRIMFISPHFTMKAKSTAFKLKGRYPAYGTLIPEYTIDYILEVVDKELLNQDLMFKIDRYVLDLHNKKIRENGAQ